jgi:hypothetical protein
VRVFSTACESSSITLLVSKWRPFSFVINRGNRKVGWMGDDNLIVFVNNSLMEKDIWERGLSSCNNQLFCRRSSGRSLLTFTSSRRKSYGTVRNWVSCQGKSFVNNPLKVKENDEHALDFALTQSRLFGSRWVWTFGVRLMLFSPSAYLIIARVSVTVFPRFVQLLMLFLCRIHCIRPDARIINSEWALTKEPSPFYLSR